MMKPVKQMVALLAEYRILRIEVGLTVDVGVPKRVRVAYEACKWALILSAGVPLWFLMQPHYAAEMIVGGVLLTRLFLFIDKEAKVVDIEDQITKEFDRVYSEIKARQAEQDNE